MNEIGIINLLYPDDDSTNESQNSDSSSVYGFENNSYVEAFLNVNLNQALKDMMENHKKRCILWKCELCGGKKKQGNVNKIRSYK